MKWDRWLGAHIQVKNKPCPRIRGCTLPTVHLQKCCGKSGLLSHEGTLIPARQRHRARGCSSLPFCKKLPKEK